MIETILSQVQSSCRVIQISVEQAAACEHEIISKDKYDFYWRPDGSGVAIALMTRSWREATV